MGTYLVTGIVQKIIVNKKDLTTKNITIDDISNRFREEINLDYYNLNENDDCYSWNIFPNVLEKNLDHFLEDQFKMYYENKEEWPIDILKKIKETSTGEEIILLASQKPSEHFQKVDNVVDIICVLDPSGFERKITIDYQLIAFFMDGKIIMETYTDILRYYSKNIRLQKEKHPIADCIKICITT